MGEKKNQKGQRWYLAVDLKSFYSSVECRERDLDPLDTNLVVADAGRTAKTICLAVSPSLKSFGIPGSPRLFEVLQRVQEINRLRRKFIQGRSLGIGSNLYLAKVALDILSKRTKASATARFSPVPIPMGRPGPLSGRWLRLWQWT